MSSSGVSPLSAVPSTEEKAANEIQDLTDELIREAAVHLFNKEKPFPKDSLAGWLIEELEDDVKKWLESGDQEKLEEVRNLAMASLRRKLRVEEHHRMELRSHKKQSAARNKR